MSDFLRGSEYVVPSRIHADRATRELHVDWPDGHHTTYDFTTLRWLCPCAFCRGEAGMPGWLDSGPTLTEAQTTLTDLQMVGQYAVAPTWADGHHTGYYTFERLREACPCADDVARRAKAAAGAPVGGRAHEHRGSRRTNTGRGRRAPDRQVGGFIRSQGGTRPLLASVRPVATWSRGVEGRRT